MPELSQISTEELIEEIVSRADHEFTEEIVSIIGDMLKLKGALEKANLSWPEVKAVRECRTICVLLICDRRRDAYSRTAVLNFLLHHGDEQLAKMADELSYRISILPNSKYEGDPGASTE